MVSDYHLHSDFSGDCKVPMGDMIQAAIEKGIQRLCFTDHHDLDFPSTTIDFTLDLEGYTSAINQFKERFGSQITLLAGIEFGMQSHLYSQLHDLISRYNFDFVLASSHLSKGNDVYDPIYFETRSQKEGYLEYFEDMLGHVKNCQDFDVYAHLDYVIRYGKFKNKTMVYADYCELLDEILVTLIKNGKGIELNTSGIRYGLGHPHPSPSILKRYYELGGTIVTLGSDAHHPKHLISHFEDGRKLLQSIGFKYHTTYIKRQAEFHQL